MFSHLPNNGAPAEQVFAGNGVVGPESQGVWITRIQHATEDFPDASRNWTDTSFEHTTFPPGTPWGPWTYDPTSDYAGGGLNNPSWDIQPNTPYRITLSHIDAATDGNVIWKYNVVNVGDFVSMNVTAKIHNDHCKVNTNTIRIKYLCKVDQELSNYCGTPISSNRGFKQDQQGTFYTEFGGYSVAPTVGGGTMPFNNIFFTANNLTDPSDGGGDDGGLPLGAFDNCGTIDPPPSVTITLATTEITNGEGNNKSAKSGEVVVLFSEPVIKFNPSEDVVVTGPGAITGAWSPAAVDGNLFRMRWTNTLFHPAGALPGSGTVTVNLGIWTDYAGQPGTKSVSAAYTAT
jgi:hypothetical protein